MNTTTTQFLYSDPATTMYTYVQRPGCKKQNTATYIHTGGVSNTYSRIRTARARVHGWVGMEKLCRCRVHAEATECVVFIGRQRNAWEPTSLDGTGDGNEAWRTAERRKRTSYGRNGGPVDREGCGVPQNGRNGLVLERYGQNGVLFIGRGVAYRKTGLHGILFMSTVALLQPPRAPVHPASTAR